MRKIALLALVVLFAASCKKETANTPLNESNTIELGTTPAPQQMPSALPKRVGFGVENDISQTSQIIQESDYRYHYLAGDIFSNGWASWNSPTGEWARTFLNQTRQMGKMPIFSYYNIVPAKGRFEDPGFTNLNDAEVMNKYFDDWKLLLKICREYGGPVIIHYEPDLLGYMQMFKNDAAKSTIKVSESNYPDVKAFTNDARGLAQAIVSMRDKYAPNVMLGWHASQWATGQDLIKGKNNPEQLAAQTAAYYKSLNAHFDLIFAEFSDRDSGYDEFVGGKGNTLWSTQANASNGNLSDFDRFQRYLKRLNFDTGQKIMLWQIPIGNTLTKTCNNTNGHYKDNRSEYFLQPVLTNGNMDKINQYAQAGVIGFLFGRGASGCTSYLDQKNDGITGSNESADDDGGYLRNAVKAYYQKGAIGIAAQ
ncbi:hypothetical protein ABDD95_01760 [Mucilaginibacter sp. PAMB04274]|uniref:hypothetical protein n=1 Tax=Mucilaginibacter sp. PAMB04274 TaxID=3138568 RepID=UPI0031F638E2